VELDVSADAVFAVVVDGAQVDGGLEVPPSSFGLVEALVAGDTRATYGYTAYGKNDTQSFSGIDTPDPQDPSREPYNVYRFNAKRFDPASGDYDMGFRDYDPGLNRFLTRDRYNGALADLDLGLSPWTMNRYGFAGGNPITLIELDGHTPSPDNPVSANPKLNTWLAGEWEAPERYEQSRRQIQANEWFYETFRIDRPNREWNPVCDYDWALCHQAAGKVARGEWTAQQGLDYFERVLRKRSGDERAFNEFLDTLAGAFPPAGPEIGALRGIRGLAAVPDDVLKATRGLAAARAISPVGALLRSTDDILRNPWLLKGMHPYQVEPILRGLPVGA